MNAPSQVLSEVLPGGLGVLTLNSPQTLNSLSLAMVQELRTRLLAWARNPSIRAVVLRGEGPKSFCAGGDVKQVALARNYPGSTYVRDFFEAEYTIDYLIRVFPKPVLALAHGLVLGGGLGLVSGASVRVLATDGQIGMPEILIGLYPDVGGSYFLSRLARGMGEFLGWTAARLNSRGALELGMVDALIPLASYPELIDSLSRELARAPAADPRELMLREVRRRSVDPAKLEPSPLGRHVELAATIGRCATPLEARTHFQGLLAGPDPWLAAGARNFLEGSPTSAWLIHEQMRRGRALGLEDCFRMEMNLSVQCFRRGDFCEGVRARLIDKDLKPRWNPPTLEQVQPAFVASFFEDCWDGGPHPLAGLETVLNGAPPA